MTILRCKDVSRKSLPVFAARVRCLSGSALKCIAFAAMAADHCAVAFLHEGTSSYCILRTIGRIAFPVFAFMAVQGYLYTHNRRRYIIGLWLFALVCEPIWRLCFGSLGCANIIFTLASGVSAIAVFDALDSTELQCRLRRFSPPGWLSGFYSLLFIVTVSWLLSPDYGFFGIALIPLYYITRTTPLISLLFSLPVFFLLQGFSGALLAALCLCLYNHHRGFISTAPRKYAFYMAYPLHLGILSTLIFFL